VAGRTLVELRQFPKKNNSSQLQPNRDGYSAALWTMLALATAFGCLIESVPAYAQALGGAKQGPGLAVGTDASATDAGTVAVGLNSVASQTGAVAVGPNANAVNGAIAVGGSTSTTPFTVAIGNAAFTTGSDSVAVGLNATDDGQTSVVSFGNASQGSTRRIINIADGVANTDAATVGQLNAAISGLTPDPTATNAYADQGDTNTLAAAKSYADTGDSNTLSAARTYADASDTNAVKSAATYTDAQVSAVNNTLNTKTKYFSASGSLAPASTTGTDSVAIGGGSTDAGMGNVVSVGDVPDGLTRRIVGVNDGVDPSDAVNVGQLTKATASTQAYTDAKTAAAVASAHEYTDEVGATTLKSANSYANNVGATILASANGYTDRAADTLLGTLNAIGFNTTDASHGVGSIAVGSNATAAGVNSASLGTNARAPAANSVAIGTDAAALRGAMDYVEPIGDANTHSVGEVSVGSARQERQITNVAAGLAATDATNVGQVEDGLTDTLATANGYTDIKLQSGMAETLGAAKAYTDATATTLARKTWGVDAKAAALASIPQAPYPGHSAVGFGIGGSHGQVGLAVGGSHFMSNSSTIVKGGLTYGANAGLTMGGGLAVVLN
jgi:autotransporter adhesin